MACGRSPTGTNINSDEQKSFITSTGTSTDLEASVVYKGGTQPRNEGISPIDPSTVQWTVPVADPSDMALVNSQKNW